MASRIPALIAFLGWTLGAVVIDRIAINVGNLVITESELVREVRLTSFFNSEKLELNSATKHKAADRLIEQKLIRKEMSLGRYMEPSPEEADEMFVQFVKMRYQTGGERALQRDLEGYNLTETDLKQQLLWQATLLRFVDVRFRPAVQISNQDVRKYYNEHYPDQKVKFGDVRDQILQTLTAEGSDKQMDEWLKDSRQRTRIELHPEAFE